MVSFRELKELIVENEIKFIEQVQHEDPKMYIDGIIDEINLCEDIDDIISFYDQHGIYMVEVFYIVTELLMNNTNLNK
jgi:hypothetical protein